MAITPNSLAPANAVSGENVPQSVAANVLKRKILIVATYDETKTAVVNEVPVRVFSKEDAGAKFGFGFMAHRLATQSFKSAPGIETYIIPQDESTSTASAGSILIDVAPGVNGTFSFYIAGLLVSVVLLAADTAAEVAGKVIAAINADPDLPVTALVNVTPEQLDLTSKSKGLYWGDAITIDSNLYGESDPGALDYTITPMTGGAGTPDITDALNALGTGSAQNSDNYTDLVHGYGVTTTVLDKIVDYNGTADDSVGNFLDLVHKPFRSLNGDTAAGSGGLAALIVIGNARQETDRTSGIIPVPGSASHPAEIAALSIGFMALQNNSQAELSYRGTILSGIHPGAMADRWTNDYSTGRDAAAQAGISCTIVEANVVKMQNALTFYHPAAVNPDTNAYRNMRNISIIQNVFAAVALEFSKKEWTQFSIVVDLAKVSNVTSRQTAKSTSSVKDTWLALFGAFAANAWIASKKYSVDKLKEDGSVVIRGSGNGFDVTPVFIFSGDGDIMNNQIKYDTSFAILQG